MEEQTKPLHEKEKRLIEFIRQLGYGKMLDMKLKMGLQAQYFEMGYTEEKKRTIRHVGE